MLHQDLGVWGFCAVVLHSYGQGVLLLFLGSACAALPPLEPFQPSPASTSSWCCCHFDQLEEHHLLLSCFCFAHSCELWNISFLLHLTALSLPLYTTVRLNSPRWSSYCVCGSLTDPCIIWNSFSSCKQRNLFHLIKSQTDCLFVVRELHSFSFLPMFNFSANC